MKKEWSQTPPQEVGFYWFYGDLFHGGMGIDYREDKPPTRAEMDLVEVFAISDGVMAKSHGQFVPLRRFDMEKRQEGPLGYWAPAQLPEPPEDIANMFRAGKDHKPEGGKNEHR